MSDLHYEILDERRRLIIPLFERFKGRFYLAGGTALALQIGHRDSIDFDFFSETGFDTAALFAQCEEVFARHVFTKTQDERDTLGVLIEKAVSVSFMGFPYPLVEPFVETADMLLASVADIGCMKLSAITSRSTMKDYVDLFFILKQMPLTQLLSYAAQKFPTLDQNLVLKSLVYFDDITDDAIRYAPGHETLFKNIQRDLEKIVKEYLRQ